jgi:hypothetical protein
MSQTYDWRRVCDAVHKCCQTLYTISLLPTQLLNLAKSTEGFSICNCACLPRNAKYATLSHCWGSITISQLLEQNISEYQNKIPWPELSQNFGHRCLIGRRVTLIRRKSCSSSRFPLFNKLYFLPSKISNISYDPFLGYHVPRYAALDIGK